MTMEQVNTTKIRDQLKYGDRIIIATMADCSIDLVKSVLSGSRAYSKGKGKKVMESINIVLNIRKKGFKLVYTGKNKSK